MLANRLLQKMELVMVCNTCGYLETFVFYNERISKQWQGKKEKLSYCPYCHNTENIK